MNHSRSPKLICLMAVIPLAYAACTPKETKTLLQPSSALGVVLAEETIRAAGSKKNIAVITHDANWGPASTVEEAFQSALRKQGFSIVTAKAANLGEWHAFCRNHQNVFPVHR